MHNIGFGVLTFNNSYTDCSVTVSVLSNNTNKILLFNSPSFVKELHIQLKKKN